MASTFGSGRQKIRQHPFITTGVIVVIFVLIVFIFAAYIFSWDWAGFSGGESKTTLTGTSNQITTAKELQPGKTLWDWLQLLIIPVVLAVGGYLFNFATSRTEHKIASDNQCDTALQTYLDRMSDLLLKGNLRKSRPQDEVRKLGRTWTKVVLTRLDPKRKGSVLKFLYESYLLEKGKRIIDISRAELNEAYLREFDLSEANLSEANLSEADLRGTDLSEADLRGTDLSEADLRGADLRGADLSGAKLQGAKYNTVVIQTRDARGNPVTIKPTQGFNHHGTGAICANHLP